MGPKLAVVPPTMPLPETVRAHCSAVAAGARHVTIHAEAAAYRSGTAGLDPDLHALEAPAEERGRYVLVLDAVNFGSGWFDALGTDTDTLTARLTRHARSRGATWEAAELRAITPDEVAGVLGLPPRHALTVLYARALRELGTWLGDRSVADRVAEARGSAAAFAESLAASLPSFADPGFHKRAQIAANDLELAGVATWADVDRLTVFADNLLPHVLRLDGVLEYAPELAARVDAGEELPHGGREEVEIRACAVNACEALAATAGVPPRTLDNWLWHRALEPAYRRRRPHRTCTTAY